MKIGKTERETLDLNGWGVGDILEGEWLSSRGKILITAVGEEKFLCRWETWRLNESEPRWGPETGNTALAGEWKKVSTNMNKAHQIRPTEITVTRMGEPLYSETSMRVSINDEGAGEFVIVASDSDDYGKVAIDPDEWPTLREVIDGMIKDCQGGSRNGQ